MPHTTREEVQEGHHFRRAFTPRLTEIITLSILSLLTLTGINSMSVIRSVDGKSYTQITDYIKSYTEKILAPTNNQQGSTVLTVLFWMFIGIVCYTLVSVFVSSYRAYKDDVVAEAGMLLPRGVSQRNIMRETLARLLVRVLATLLFFYWLYLFFSGILPSISNQFLESITHLSIGSLLQVLLSVVFMAASLFVMIILARCIVLRERVFSR